MGDEGEPCRNLPTLVRFDVLYTSKVTNVVLAELTH